MNPILRFHGINTRHGVDLHSPKLILTTFQKGAFCFGIGNCLRSWFLVNLF